MFVSTTRLTVHNIPKNIDDAGLKAVFAKAVGVKNYAIKEVSQGEFFRLECVFIAAVFFQSRVIRDLEVLDLNGHGKSRGFGFIEFKNHRDALKAVAAVNNNPDIFTADKVLSLDSFCSPIFSG